MTEFKKYLMAKDITKFTGLTVTYLRRISDDGLISYYKTIGGHRRYCLEDVLEHIEANLVRKTEQPEKKKKKTRRYLKEL